MKELISILDLNNIKYDFSDYAGHESIVIKNKHYKLEIYYDNGYVSDLQRVPYSWGIMGSTTLDSIIEDLEKYFDKNCLKENK